ncbi:MAG: GNAT family N-acetyltransferase [Myxococcota bacterium]|nr:GNAT family N-acetyltransferase [Myxococcota bacterium]
MILTTARLTLREVESRDIAVLASYQSDPRYLEHYPERPDAERIAQLAHEWALATPRLNHQLMITLGSNGPVIGCAGVRQAGCPSGEAEVGVELNPDHWGAGYAREALLELIEFARKDLGLRKLSALTTPANLRAHRLLQSLGFSATQPLDENACFTLSVGAVTAASIDGDF